MMMVIIDVIADISIKSIKILNMSIDLMGDGRSLCCVVELNSNTIYMYHLTCLGILSSRYYWNF